MSTTTVKIRESTKSALDEIKKQKESYDEVIERLVSKEKKNGLKEQLIKAYKELGNEDLEMLREWEVASKELDEDD